jgi:gamma-glutamyltranspeptidase / glutathione hydrolase / leukotriene-C4 hydrolase
LPASQAKFVKFIEKKIHSSASLRETYVNQMNNEIYKANSLIRRPKLAKTLEIIAREGESAFYNGELTEAIVDEIRSEGGIITATDLNNYKCLIKQPIKYKLKSNDYELNSAPAPSCGILVNFILALLDGIILFLNMKTN